MIVGWSSKKQKTFFLSRCESKYIANGEACQEAIFMNQLLEELFETPTNEVVYGDNQGSLFLVKHCQVSLQTKHIDMHMSAFHQRAPETEKRLLANVSKAKIIWQTEP